MAGGWDCGQQGSFNDLYYLALTSVLQQVKQEADQQQAWRGSLFNNLSWRGRFEGTMTGSDKLWMQEVIRAFEAEQHPDQQGFSLQQFEAVMPELLPRYRHDQLPLSVLFKVFDADGSGIVSLGEICVGLAMLQSGTLDEKLELCFKVFDASGKGWLTRDELSKLSRIISRLMYGTDDPARADAEARAMFQDMDMDKDEKVTLREFSGALRMRSMVQSFFREVGISQQTAGPEQQSSALSAVRVSEQLRRFLPAHKIREVQDLLQKHLLASAHGPSPEGELDWASQQLYIAIGESVLNQASMRAAASAHQTETFMMLGQDSGEPSQEMQGLLAGESILLDVPQISLKKQTGQPSRKVQLAASLALTNYRLMVNFSQPGQSDERALAFIPVGAISKVRSSAAKRTISVRSKYCFLYVHLVFDAEIDFEETIRLLNTLMLKSDVSIQRAFAFVHASDDVPNAGWNTYDAESDFRRMGVPSMEWRFCTLNQKYERCDTYPSLLVVPSTATDDTVRAAMAARKDGRIPILTYWNAMLQIGLLQCGEFTMNLRGSKLQRANDNNLVLNCMEAANENGVRLFVRVNGKPPSKSEMNAAMGTFRSSIYPVQIPDGPATMKALYALQKKHRQGVNYAESRWCQMTRGLLRTAGALQSLLQQPSSEGGMYGGVALFDSAKHESAPLCSLLQVLLCPIARTVFGFEVLIEKEWASLGYPFSTAFGHTCDDWFSRPASSAVFIMFLDAVRQLITAQPNRFEFDERLLLAISQHVFSCRFGDFLADSEHERHRIMIRDRTKSLWSLVNPHREQYTNSNYKMSDEPLVDVKELQLQYWSAQYDSMSNLDQVGSLHKEVSLNLWP